MHQFALQQGLSGELQLFPHITELGAKKNQAIHLNSFPQSTSECIRIYYVNEGKFEWRVNDESYILYPGDVSLIMPNEKFGSEKGVLEIGSISWIHIKISNHGVNELLTGRWSSISETEGQPISKVLLLNQFPRLPK